MSSDKFKDTPQILELIKKSQAGNSVAEGKLVHIYKPYVDYMVRRYSKKTEIKDDDDLRSYILIGLIEGIRKFNKSKNTRFIYFAHTWMKKNIFLGEGVHRFIRVPINQKIFYDNFNKEMFENEFKELDEIEGDIQKFTEIDNTKVSYFEDLCSYSNEDQEVYEVPENLLHNLNSIPFYEEENKMSFNVLKSNVKKVLSNFNDKEIYIITHTFGLDGAEVLSSEHIAKNLNVTKVNITFTKTRVIRMLRHNYFSSQILSEI